MFAHVPIHFHSFSKELSKACIFSASSTRNQQAFSLRIFKLPLKSIYAQKVAVSMFAREERKLKSALKSAETVTQ